MKSIKYLLTAILMVSTGLSAMEPAQNNALVPAKVQAVRAAGSMEAYELGKIQVRTVAEYQPEVVQLPQHIVQRIADYAGVNEEAREERRQQRRIEFERLNEDVKKIAYSLRAISAGIGGIWGSQFAVSFLNDQISSSESVMLSISIALGGVALGVGEKSSRDFFKKYPLLYLKHAFNFNTTEYMINFGYGLALSGLGRYLTGRQ